MQMDATALRQDLYETLKHLDEPIEILRNGRVVAVLAPPPLSQDAEKPRYDLRRLARICERHHVKKLALFGSITREDFSAESDVDVLIKTPDNRKTLRHYATLLDDLEDLFSRKVDLHYFDTLEKYASAETKASVMRDARVIYERR